MNPESISLYFCQGTSDKEYHAELVAKDGDFVVNFRYGRRGASLTAGTKTKDPVAYDKAKKIYDKLVGEKLKKGYSPGETGAAYQDTTLEDRFTGVLPQLLNAITESELTALLLSHQYVAQEKFDGKRCLIRKRAQRVEGINRRGLVVALPKAIEVSVQGLKAAAAILDGELIGEVFHAFDLLEYAEPGLLLDHDVRDLSASPYCERYAQLETLLSAPSDTLRIVASAEGTAAKRELLDQVRAAGGEGVVLKDIDAPYTSGRPSSGGTQLKYKLTASATCRVAKQNGSKRSVALELDEDGVSRGVGNVTIPANYDIPAMGALVEVEYLYAYRGGSLFQPVYRGERDDLPASAATLSQLKYKAEVPENED